MIRLSGTHTCRNCGKTYDWQALELESGQIAGFYQEEDRMKNVCNTEPNSVNLYTVRLKCPKCGSTSEFVDAEPER